MLRTPWPWRSATCKTSNTGCDFVFRPGTAQAPRGSFAEPVLASRARKFPEPIQYDEAAGDIEYEPALGDCSAGHASLRTTGHVVGTFNATESSSESNLSTELPGEFARDY